MIKYRASSSWGRGIEAFEVVKETEKQIVYVSDWCGKRTENRVAKASSYNMWFDTWEEAHAYLVEKANNNVERLRLQLERAKGEAGQIRGMKKPS